MQQMYKVFYNDRVIFLLERSDNLPENVSIRKVNTKQEMNRILKDYFTVNPTQDLAFSAKSLGNLFRDFKTLFHYIEAAGGLVKNSEEKFLFIKRWGIWDLPKGKSEKNESRENTAIREVEEETGIEKLKIEQKLPDIYHIYQREKQFILKRTSWFMMSVEDCGVSKPQFDEGITEVAWFNREESHRSLNQSYRSLKETMMQYLSTL
jgi:ADP-ribose pyrophosphatase YjhB (NUDIX family)